MIQTWTRSLSPGQAHSISLGARCWPAVSFGAAEESSVSSQRCAGDQAIESWCASAVEGMERRKKSTPGGRERN